jgi:hypothetical protein
VLYSGSVTEGASQQERGVGREGTRAAAWLAWSLAGLCVAMFVATITLSVLARSAQASSSWGAERGVRDLLASITFLPFLVFPMVGALIASRRPHNPIGWILLADGLLWMLISAFEIYSVYGVVKPGSVPFPVAIAALNNGLWVPTVGLLGTYVLLLFPDGRLLSRRWRPLAWLSGVVIVLLSITGIFTPEPLQNLGGVQNPFGLEGQRWVAAVGWVVLPLLPLCMLASALSLVLRYRRSGGDVREQIKWIAFAASFMGVLYLGIMSAGTVMWVVSAPETPIELGARSLWGAILENVTVLSFACIPVAIGFAVLKYRLYDIDLIINRTLVYSLLTGALALVYFGGVATTQALFRALTGQVKHPQLAIVVSTLVIAALFNPLRRRIQAFIDRRFYRSKYDAAKTLEAFSAKLRDETDLDALSDDLVGVVRETMQPAHVTLWLRPDTVDTKDEVSG